jgi:hypothetical protein
MASRRSWAKNLQFCSGRTLLPQNRGTPEAETYCQKHGSFDDKFDAVGVPSVERRRAKHPRNLSQRAAKRQQN